MCRRSHVLCGCDSTPLHQFWGNGKAHHKAIDGRPRSFNHVRQHSITPSSFKTFLFFHRAYRTLGGGLNSPKNPWICAADSFWFCSASRASSSRRFGFWHGLMMYCHMMKMMVIMVKGAKRHITINAASGIGPMRMSVGCAGDDILIYSVGVGWPLLIRSCVWC